MHRAHQLSVVIALAGLFGGCAPAVSPAPAPGGNTPVNTPGTTPPSSSIWPDGAPAPASDGGVAAGSASCSGIVACFFTNECEDDSCYQGCVALGSVAAQQQYNALEQCEDGSSCSTCSDDNFDVTCATCLDAACKQQYTACGKTLSCKQANDCGDNCSDDACWSACLAKMSALGLAQYIAAEDCWDSSVAGGCAASCTDPRARGE